MRDRTRMRSLSFRSDNRKSKIQNRKWVGIVAPSLSHSRYVERWRGAAAEESPPDRISIAGRSQLLILSVPSHFGWLCASLAI